MDKYIITIRTILPECFCIRHVLQKILMKFVRVIKIAVLNVGYDVAIYSKFLGAFAEV